MTDTSMFAIGVVEFRGSKNSLKIEEQTHKSPRWWNLWGCFVKLRRYWHKV